MRPLDIRRFAMIPLLRVLVDIPLEGLLQDTLLYSIWHQWSNKMACNIGLLNTHDLAVRPKDTRARDCMKPLSGRACEVAPDIWVYPSQEFGSLPFVTILL